MLEWVAFTIIAVFFGIAAVNHIVDHNKMVAYLGTVVHNKYLKVLGGVPTGIYLSAVTVGILMHAPWALFMAAGFLAVTQVLFHSDLTGAANQKHLALMAAMLALAVLL